MSKQHGRENDTVAVEAATTKSDVAQREEAIQSFWAEHDIFNKSVEQPACAAPKGDYVFYDGPPFATGLPHYGHILAGTIKDTIPRFWTMNGYRVRRKWGWDCHGLPLENLIEKRLGLSNKRDIEEYGIQNFNEAARGAVLEYADDWRRIIPRMGRFVDMEDDYKTMDSSYTESVWWVFKTLHEKGLVHEGFKTMHLCPRCGTTLSNFEVNQGYKDIKDIAVTVKLPLLDDAGTVTDTSLLVWTTTPWTLPGNLAAAVHQDFEYAKVRLKTDDGEEFVILAKGRLAQLAGMEYEVVETISGSDLVGRAYQPPFPWLQGEDFDQANAWKIWHADYVELGDEGTGAVHLAPAYGEDDLVLAQTNGIPVVHHVDYEGRFMSFVKDFAGQLVKPKDSDAAGVTHLDADIEIVKALKRTGALLKKENITHSYPHCWRDDTPLLNYATTSWFVNVPKIKDELVAANNTVNWVPGHVGKNRFGKWLEGARDWAVSRQRYWGAPLPIWKNPATGEYKVFGSLAELQAYVPKGENQYFIMRHGEAESNLDGRISALPDETNKLTEKGQQQVKSAVATELSSQNIDLVIHSGLMRTKQTAEQVVAALGLSTGALVEDARLLELQAGADIEGQSWQAYQDKFADEVSTFEDAVDGTENRRDVIRRVGALLYELEETYHGKNILLVGHASSLFSLEMAAQGADNAGAIAARAAGWLDNAVVKAVPFTPMPHNDDYILDYHRPYIDDIALYENGVRLERVPDVFDCWFESGAMPYAETHYPFENLAVANMEKGIRFPANFISESVDQTRGWFYSLLVLGVALSGKSPFENVITNGLVLAEDGKKMSKSLQNYPDPMALADRVGVDAIRYYLLSSSIIRGEDLNFSEKEVLELQRKNLGRLHNVLAMYQLYADGTAAQADSTHVLDRWILARLNQLVTETTQGYQKYELDKATRPLTDFIDDVSVWYLRRSRERLKSDNRADKTMALATLRYILRQTALTMAPVMPFYADYLWQQVREATDAESVHLAAWPDSGSVDAGLLTDMQTVRDIVNAALEQRTKAGIKVRQPLATLWVAGAAAILTDANKEIIADELNVKAVVHDSTLPSLTQLDTNLTQELLAEGAVRELMRAVQDVRKQRGLQPADPITLTIATDAVGQAAVVTHQELLQKTVGAAAVSFAQADGFVVTVGDYTFAVHVKQLAEKA